ncbi:TetR/AcrR family transcriptional regulator [Deinococcus oregonensis]|uniref:TetR/AcrR family transcriptional regulator n=1 Tax=Deinococcus oregonensis TaxID=1805970 RepID=A0ABV6B5X4_9DEIO
MTQVNSSHLTHRQRQALATRQLIIDAATTLFLERGYVATTIDTIAQHAGVAVSTVYNTFGNKSGILAGIRAAWVVESGVNELYHQADQERDFNRRLQLAAHTTRRVWETSARMMAVHTTAAGADPDAAAEWQVALNGRRTTLARIYQAWASEFGGDPERTAAIAIALTGPEMYLELVTVWHWTPDQYEDWLAQLLQQQLLGASMFPK